jgi:serine/threonine-protein kinase
MADVFVSYKAEDRRRVEPLVRSLESDGFSVWWDAHIGGGDRWRETILKNLEEAPCVIVIWSKRSTGPEGEFVRDEATRARRRNTYLPVRIDKVEPPLGFGEMQALSLTGWKGDAGDGRYQALLEAVRGRVGHEPGPSRRDTPAGMNRRTALIGAASVAAIGVAGASAWVLSKHGAVAASIAVLPFENLSGDPAQAYFSDGIAEELRSALSRIAGLKVVARTSSEAVRNDDAKTAAHKLDVSNILTGSVRRSPSIVRISAQLVDGRDGTERWSQDYDRPAGDALQIQSDIANSVASALALRLAPAAGGRLTLGGTSNPEAHDLFLKGVAIRQGEHTAENMRHAIQVFDQAIRLDPTYADAYALKSTALWELTSAFSKNANQMKSGFEQAAACANKALSLSPDLPAAHAALAAVASSAIDFSRALAEFRRAAAGPQDPVILFDYAGFLSQIGFTSEAHKIGKEIIALDPLSARSYVPDATAFYSARQYVEGVKATERVLALMPDAAAALAQLADCFVNLGKFDQARRAFEQMPADDVFRITGEAILNVRLGNRDAAKAAADKVQRLYDGAASYQVAQIHAQRGDKDAAFAALAEAIVTPDPGLIALLVDPYMDPLRGDERFSAIKVKINFPPGLPG